MILFPKQKVRKTEYKSPLTSKAEYFINGLQAMGVYATLSLGKSVIYHGIANLDLHTPNGTGQTDKSKNIDPFPANDPNVEGFRIFMKDAFTYARATDDVGIELSVDLRHCNDDHETGQRAAAVLIPKFHTEHRPTARNIFNFQVERNILRTADPDIFKQHYNGPLGDIWSNFSSHDRTQILSSIFESHIPEPAKRKLVYEKVKAGFEQENTL